MTTHTVTLNLPESLYRQLQRRSEQLQRSLEDELLALLIAKIPATADAKSMPPAYNEVIEFLGRGATAKEITQFKLSAEAQARAQMLLQKNKEGLLTPAEEAELDLYVDLEEFMALLKNRALQQLQSSQ